MVAFQATIHDSSITLLRNTFLCNLGVNPLGETPHLGPDLAKLNGGRCKVLNGVLECLVEVAIVQEDVWVMVPSVEVALDGLDGLNNTFEFLVSGQDDKGAVGAGLGGVRLETALDEDLVILLADFSVRRRGSACKVKRRGAHGGGLT